MPDDTTSDDVLQVDTGTGAPAGPGAESMNPAQPGEAMPGDPEGAQSDDGAAMPSEMEGKQ